MYNLCGGFMKLIMIKYGELTTKKANRNLFVNALDKNIKNLLKDYITISKNFISLPH